MKKILSFLCIVLCLVVFTIMAFLQNTVSKNIGKENFPSLTNEVKVHYDKFGIPHIEATTDLDGYRALGYVTAGERLFQMDLMRRLVGGSLSEIFGEKTLDSDVLLRRLRLKKNAQQNLIALEADPVNQRILSYAKAYLEGVHHYMDTRPLPVEFILLNYVPKHFELSDILGVSGYMSLTFAEGMTGDVFLSELLSKLPEDKMKVLRIGSDTDHHYFPDQKIVRNKFLNKLKLAIDGIGEVLPLFHGSNSWVLSGSRTESGKPILANDPHIGVSNPHVFFEAHLKTPNLELYGNYIPLLTFPVMGHTKYSAWGLTMSEVDDLNIYQEKFNPNDPSKVMFKNEWVDVEEYTETIKVKDGKTREIKVVLTPHGPLLDGTKYGVEDKNLSLHWSVHHKDNNTLKGLYDISLANSPTDLRNAVSLASAPGLNISWVSTKGDIAWWAMGKYPKLPDGIATDIVLNGWDGSAEVERYYSVDENPHDVNPVNGAIITANYRPQYSEFSHFDGYWQPSGRYFRIEKKLRSKIKWSLDDIKKLQTDDYIPIQERLHSKLFEGIITKNLTKKELRALNLIKNWDGKSDIKSIGSSIYHSWNYFLTRNIFLDELGEEGYMTLGRTADFFHAFKRLVYNQNHSFWDDIRTDRVESGADIITQSFKDSIADLTKKLGYRIEFWNWGRLHQVEYKHPLGSIKPLNYFFNIGPVQANGGRYVINNLGHKKTLNDFSVVHAPATRRIIDMANTKESFGIFPTGNSGNPFSPHFKDQLKIYHRGEYRTQTMNWESIKEITPLVLTP
jgi:penicillin amidase